LTGEEGVALAIRSQCGGRAGHLPRQLWQCTRLDRECGVADVHPQRHSEATTLQGEPHGGVTCADHGVGEGHR
jgi:hypothetical protein